VSCLLMPVLVDSNCLAFDLAIPIALVSERGVGEVVPRIMSAGIAVSLKTSCRMSPEKVMALR
jgi:hypothetical protein